MPAAVVNTGEVGRDIARSLVKPVCGREVNVRHLQIMVDGHLPFLLAAPVFKVVDVVQVVRIPNLEGVVLRTTAAQIGHGVFQRDVGVPIRR